MIQAYFDESGTHDGSPVMCVAGYIIDSRQCIYLQNDWDAILKLYGLDYFHMTECAHGTGAFKSIDKAGRIDICRRLIELIKLRVEIGIVVSLCEADFNEVMPSSPRIDAYTFCAKQCIDGVMTWRDKFQDTNRCAYFLEAGHHSQSKMDSLIRWLISDPKFEDWYGYSSHSFVSAKESKKLAGLCAADLLAWEWRKEYVNRFGPVRRTRRLSLESLLAKTHIAIHYSRDDLAQYVSFGVQLANGI